MAPSNLVSVIMSTYNAEEWLEKVIWGFAQQSISNFEIVVADDGSRETTKRLIDNLRIETGLIIQHVWQQDNGFQKCKILNKAIVAAKGDYLIFTDGDCIPRADFIENHLKFREPGFFLSGGYYKLPLKVSQKITKEDIKSQNCFKISWLAANGLRRSAKNLKLVTRGYLSSFLNSVTPTNASWNGHNSSAWKSDLLAVNGFDEEMQYGGEDRELGERLFNLGLKSKQIRYNAICIHLDHERGYVNDAAWEKNARIRKFTKENKVVRTPNGIKLELL